MRKFMGQLPPAPDPAAASPELRDANLREALARAEIAEIELEQLKSGAGPTAEARKTPHGHRTHGGPQVGG